MRLNDIKAKIQGKIHVSSREAVGMSIFAAVYDTVTKPRNCYPSRNSHAVISVQKRLPIVSDINIHVLDSMSRRPSGPLLSFASLSETMLHSHPPDANERYKTCVVADWTLSYVASRLPMSLFTRLPPVTHRLRRIIRRMFWVNIVFQQRCFATGTASLILKTSLILHQRCILVRTSPSAFQGLKKVGKCCYATDQGVSVRGASDVTSSVILQSKFSCTDADNLVSSLPYDVNR